MSVPWSGSEFELYSPKWFFLDASTHLYMRVCPSVGLSVRPSVRPSVGPSRVFFKLGNQQIWQIWHIWDLKSLQIWQILENLTNLPSDASLFKRTCSLKITSTTARNWVHAFIACRSTVLSVCFLTMGPWVRRYVGSSVRRFFFKLRIHVNSCKFILIQVNSRKFATFRKY